MLKRLFVLVVLLVPALAWGACPRSIAGNYSYSLMGGSSDGLKEFGVGTMTLLSNGTGSFRFYAGGDTRLEDEVEEEDLNQLLRYEYQGRCAGRVRYSDDEGEQVLFFVVKDSGRTIEMVSGGATPERRRVTFWSAQKQ